MGDAVRMLLLLGEVLHNCQSLLSIIILLNLNILGLALDHLDVVGLDVLVMTFLGEILHNGQSSPLLIVLLDFDILGPSLNEVDGADR